MSNSQLGRLRCDEIIKLILVSGIPVQNVERIHTMESDTLVRLVYVARENCRRETLADRK